MNTKHRKKLICGAIAADHLLPASSAHAYGVSTLLSFMYTTLSGLVGRIVNTMETALTTNQAAETYLAASQKTAEAINAAITQESIVKAYEDYGPENLPEDVDCNQLDKARAANQVGEASKTVMRLTVRDWITDSPQGGKSTVLKDNLEFHLSNACTPIEAANGLCKLKTNGYAGADINAGVMLEKVTCHETCQAYFRALASNMIGPGVTSSRESMINSPDGSAAMLTQNTATARNSAALQTILVSLAGSRMSMTWDTQTNTLKEPVLQ